MKKNKLIWSIVLFLFALVSIPIAYAQTVPTGSRIFFILINAAVIGIVLFILQAILLHGKPDKERVSAWFIVIVASLLISFLYGQTGFIWQTGPLARFFSVYVIVNSIIIGAVLYFLLGLLPIGKNLKSPEGNVGYGLLIFLVALIFAVKIGNQWIWNQAVVAQLIGYLFGPAGILNPSPPAYRLWTFLGASILLSFFFNNFLIKMEGGGKGINWALAILIASNMASSGVSVRSVIILGEIIFWIVLSDALKSRLATATKEGKQSNVWAWVVSFILVGWASAAATYGTDYQGILATLVGKPLSWMGFITAPSAAPTPGWGWWGWILGAVIVALIFGLGGSAAAGFGSMGILGAIAVLALLIFLIPGLGIGAFLILGIPLLLFFGIARGETRERVLTSAMRGLKKRFNALIRSGKFLEDTAKGQEPLVIQENRLLFHMLANYTTRSEITYRYWGFVKQAKRVGTKVLAEIIQKHVDQEALKNDIRATRSGGTTEEGAHFVGWNKLNAEVVDLVNEFFETLYLTYLAFNLGFKEEPKNEFYRYESTKLEAIHSRASNLLTELHSNREQYKQRMKAYGGHHVLKAYREILLSMTNVTGEVLQHPQKFARPDVKFDMGDQTGKPKVAGKDARGYPTDEVNQFGEVIADINEQKKNNRSIYDKFGDIIDPRLYKRPRKVKPEDIIDYPDFTTFVANIELDWKGLAEDIRYGLWHPDSRTFEMYKQGLAHGVYGDYDDARIPLTIAGHKLTNPPYTGDEAIDMRAMADPGKNVYWGREMFDERSPSPPDKNNPFHNPYPLVSSLGAKKYLQQRVYLGMKDKASAVEYLNRYPADTGAPEKVMEGKEVITRIGTRAGVGVEKPKEG